VVAVVSKPLGLLEFLPPSVVLVEAVVFLSFVFALSLLVQQRLYGFWVVEKDRCWRFCRWRCCSKLDLLTSAGFPLIRTFLLRSSALSGLDGHSAGPCSSLMFGA